MYDLLIVGSGLYGSTFAHLAHEAGLKCLVIEKRKHLGGNVYCDIYNGITIHTYGAHIFHTDNTKIWNFVNAFAPFNNYTHQVIANYHGRIFNLPFNMNTFYQLWGCVNPNDAYAKIKSQQKKNARPQNLEEQALVLVGKDIYEILIKEYTEKQWGRKCNELPSSIIKRIPLRFIFSNNYFNDTYQGIPVGGYNTLISSLLANNKVLTDTDFFSNKPYFQSLAKYIVYTGEIDKFFDYCYGPLEWRTVRFQTEILRTKNYQGVSVANYTSHDEKFTRIIEHKHFDVRNVNYDNNETVISKEFSDTWQRGMEPFYPINDEKNNAIFQKYKTLAKKHKNVILGGRLADYAYYDMDDVIEKAINDFEIFRRNTIK